MTAFIGGFDWDVGNAKSCVFRTFKDKCIPYALGGISIGEQWKHLDICKVAVTVVVHSYGLYAFILARMEGLFQNVEELVVLDGAYPKTFNFKEHMDLIRPEVRCVFVYPTVGDRSGYRLESEWKPRPLDQIVRCQNFGHNFLYNEFDEAKMEEFVKNLVASLSVGEPGERTITFPNVC